jgi:epoxyqueuosine reductase
MEDLATGMRLIERIRECGYQARIVPIAHLCDLEGAIRIRYDQGLLDQELYQAYLTAFTFRPPESMPGARSLIVVTVPQPQFRLSFTWGGEPFSATVPPTYLFNRETESHVGDLLARSLEPAGYHLAAATLPEKLLAVSSGLAAFGKNNISYVPGMGSFHRPTAFYSDLPCPEDPWRAPAMMDRCQKCTACLRACPSGAIVADRFLIHAERCITFHNEKPRDIPFPAWLDPAWHSCLVGCLRCQRICPENRDVLGWIEDGPSFSEQETWLFVEGVPLEQLPGATVEKLRQGDLVGLCELFPRNLSVFLSGRLRTALDRRL